MRDTNLAYSRKWPDYVTTLSAWAKLTPSFCGLTPLESQRSFLPNTHSFIRNVKCWPLPLRLRRSTMYEELQYYYTLYSSNSNQPQETYMQHAVHMQKKYIVTAWKTERKILQRAGPELTHCVEARQAWRLELAFYKGVNFSPNEWLS